MTSNASSPLRDTHETSEAVRARKFVLSLLEFEGVEEAIVEAGGWGNIEMWASALNTLKGSADIDAPLILLADVGEFKCWLRSEPTWQHACERAEGAFRSLLDVPALRKIVERARQRSMCPEAYQLLRQDILEAAHDRFKILELRTKELKATVDVEVMGVVVGQSAGKGTDRSSGTAEVPSSPIVVTTTAHKPPASGKSQAKSKSKSKRKRRPSIA